LRHLLIILSILLLSHHPFGKFYKNIDVSQFILQIFKERNVLYLI